MDYLELQKRANLIVDKVNQYEADLAKVQVNETDLLNQHKYCDIFCLRPVLKLLLGSTVEDKIDRSLTNNVPIPVYCSSAPADNSYFDLFTHEFVTDRHEYMNNIDMYNKFNMLQLDVQQNTLTDRDTRIKQGINFGYSANIKDALAIESQVANMFKWNTTSIDEIQNNTITVNRQVPGIVTYYLGNNYDGTYTATIPYCQSTLNSVNYSTPVSYGAYYMKDETLSQIGLEMGAECCRIFIPGMQYTRGKLESPQQIWQPDIREGEANIGLGYNWQGQALYHELVYKDKRQGDCDFSAAYSEVSDNDPQGLVIRTVLAKQKEFYKNRPFFEELTEISNIDTNKLASTIIEQEQTKYTLNTELMSVVGTPVISDDCLFTDFGSNGYLQITHPTEAINTFNYRCQFITHSDMSSTDWLELLARSTSGSKLCPMIEVNYGRPEYSVIVQWSANGTSWSTSLITNYTYLPNTRYEVNFIFNGSEGYVTIQDITNNGEVVTGSTTTSSGIKFEIDEYIGNVAGATATNNETKIDLTETEITCSLASGSTYNFKAATKEVSIPTDEEFYKSYQLNYDVYKKGIEA